MQLSSSIFVENAKIKRQLNDPKFKGAVSEWSLRDKLNENPKYPKFAPSLGLGNL